MRRVLVAGLLALCLLQVSCVSVCEDGIWEAGEDCDIGYNDPDVPETYNQYYNDFDQICSNCVLTPGWVCFEKSYCVVDRCGDGYRVGNEECEYDETDSEFWGNWGYCDPETCTI